MTMKTDGSIELTDKLYAFWRYDQFPYFLGAEILHMHSSGSIEPKGYKGYRFFPVCILPLGAGKRIHEELKKLEEAYKSAQEKLRKEYMNKHKEKFHALLPLLEQKE